MDPLVRRIESPGVTDHAHEPRFALRRGDGLGVGPRIGEGDLDLDVLAGAQGLDGLLRVHLSGRRQNDGVDVRGT